MKITSIEYGRLVNLGRYENEHLNATAEIAEDEDPAAAYAALRQYVHDQLGLKPPEPAASDLEDLPY